MFEAKLFLGYLPKSNSWYIHSLIVFSEGFSTVISWYFNFGIVLPRKTSGWKPLKMSRVWGTEEWVSKQRGENIRFFSVRFLGSSFFFKACTYSRLFERFVFVRTTVKEITFARRNWVEQRSPWCLMLFKSWSITIGLYIGFLLKFFLMYTLSYGSLIHPTRHIFDKFTSLQLSD